MAEQLGHIAGLIFVWALVPAAIGMIQWLLTRDAQKARSAAFSWRAIILAFGFLFLRLFAHYVERFS